MNAKNENVGLRRNFNVSQKALLYVRLTQPTTTHELIFFQSIRSPILG